MEPTIITSTHNPRIKQLRLLQEKSAERRRQGLFVVEGRRELGHCKAAGYEIDTIFLCKEAATSGLTENRATTIELLEGVPHIYEVSEALYERIAYRGSTEGVVALVKMRDTRLDDLSLRRNALVVVVESVEKPGNLGAILRSADAAGVDAVLVCDPLTDLYNPNLIRSSVGAAFSVPMIACSSEECIAFLQARKFSILTAQLQDSKPYYDTCMTGATALVLGTESTGLTDIWRQVATAHIRIPMQGRLDSLNVAVSASILIFEAVRQRMTT